MYLLAKASKLVCCDGLWGRGGDEVHSEKLNRKRNSSISRRWITLSVANKIFIE